METIVRGIIFDLDGVLTDTSELHYLAWKRLGRELGIPIPVNLKDEVRGQSRRASLAKLLDGSEISEDEAEALMERKNRFYLELISDISPADALPGVHTLLDEIRNVGIRVAVASASRNAGTVLTGLMLTDKIDAVCDGSIVRVAKPAPDIFLCASNRLDLEPAQCLVVEDAHVGIVAARAAGMRVIGLGALELVGAADAVFPSLEHVRLSDLLSVT